MSKLGDRQRKGLLFSFPDLIAYEVKVNQRDIEGEHRTPAQVKGRQPAEERLATSLIVRPWQRAVYGAQLVSPPPAPRTLTLHLKHTLHCILA